MVVVDEKPVDEAFVEAGKEAGIEIWRIESMKIVPVPREFYGQFYDGDSYIILKTRQVENKLEWDLHFWLGSETSQDEQGVAAYKTVELDDSLGGAPVQYREVQNHESKKFLANFKNGVKYLKGGVASGFRHVTPDIHEPRLLQVKGKRNVRCRQVECSCSSLNQGDVFILDALMDIYVWYGEKAGRMEKHKAVRIANDIRDSERQGRAFVSILDGSTADDEFFEKLGGRGEIASAEEGGEDDADVWGRKVQVSLYKICDQMLDETNKAIKAVKVGVAPLKQADLDPKDCFILDAGMSGIFSWIGKESSNKERAAAMQRATHYLTVRGYPNWVAVTRVVDGAEPPMFRQHFSSWTEPDDAAAPTFGSINVYPGSTPPAAPPAGVKDLPSISKRRKRITAWGPLAKHGGRACGFMPDDGTGIIQIWRIEKFKMVPLEEDKYGMFCGGDSYVIRYTYQKKLKDGKKSKKDNYIVYFWQGKESTQDEKAASAFHAVKLDDELGGKAVQIRVVQGKEPDHFLHMFKGRMVILMGGKASGFRNIHDHDTFDVDGTRLFHIRGTAETNTRAIQVPEVTASLNSEDVFLLETPGNTFIWHGKGAEDFEKNMASGLAPIVSPDVDPVIIQEAEEPEEFWIPLGGAGDYPTKHIWNNPPCLPPRLFQINITNKRLRVEEIEDFVQTDLEGDDVMILDSGADEIFIWVGKGATNEERKKAHDLGVHYLNQEPTPRTDLTSVFFEIKQGSEPDTFCGYFGNWDKHLWAEE